MLVPLIWFGLLVQNKSIRIYSNVSHIKENTILIHPSLEYMLSIC